MKKNKARLVVFDQGKILVLKTRKFEDRYTYIGGTISSGETPEETIQREAYEEAGLFIRKGKLELLFTYCAFPNKEKTCNHFFTTTQTDLIPKLMEEHKFSWVGWADVHAILPFLKTRDQAIATRLILRQNKRKRA